MAAEFTTLLSSKSSRTKRRRIHDNVQRAILEITSDSTQFTTPPDGAEAECEDATWDVADSEPDFPVNYSVNPDGSPTGATVFTCANIFEEQDVREAPISSESECSDTSDHDSDEFNDDGLADEISNWAKQCNILQSHVGALLSVLRKYHPRLPKDPRTLFETPREVSVRELTAGGGYYHFGIKQVLQNMRTRGLLELLPNEHSVMLQLSIDGLQLFKSSAYQFWPILGSVVNAVRQYVFEVGLYGGCQKPSDVSEYLSDLVSEMKQLETDGIVFGDVKYSVSVHSIVCDAPARSYVKCIKPHNSYHGCERCIEDGKWIAGRVTFLSTDKPLRTDDSFRNKADDDHHIGESPIACLNVGLVTQFPLDEMHLVYLGVMRRLIMCWLRGPIETKCRLPGQSVRTISDRLLSVQRYICCEFVRKPRSLSEIDRWKATEFRTFLLYLGPIVLKGILSKQHFRHFMLLHVAMYCLTSSRLCSSHLDYAQMLLSKFVQEAPELYGPEFVVYNVHSLIHICDDARLYGHLHAVNAFVYESHLKQVKKFVQHANNPLKQAVKRIIERQNGEVHAEKHAVRKDVICQKQHSSGPVCSSISCVKQFMKLICSTCTITSSVNNNCVLFSNGDIGFVRNIVQSDGDEVFLLCERFGSVGSFFNYPCKSEDLGHCLVATKLSPTLLAVKAAAIASKCLCLPHDRDSFVIIPLCHI